jgi:hypothetical protein
LISPTYYLFLVKIKRKRKEKRKSLKSPFLVLHMLNVGIGEQWAWTSSLSDSITVQIKKNCFLDLVLFLRFSSKFLMRKKERMKLNEFMFLHSPVWECDFNKYNFKNYVFKNCVFEIATF